VSPGAGLLTSLNGAVWLAYGVLIRHPGAGAAGVLSCPLGLFIALRSGRVGAAQPPLP